MTADLHAYLQQPRSGSFVRGLTDCGAFVAGWMSQVMGRPVQAAFLGGSLTEPGLRRLVLRAGGMPRLARGILMNHGWQRAPTPQDGDIIVAVFPDGCAQTLLGIWSAGYAVTIDRHAQLRIVPPQQLRDLQTWRYAE